MILNGPRNGSAALGVMQGGVEIPAAEMEHVQHAQKPGLAEDVAVFFGNRKASIQCHARRIALSEHVHRGDSQARLKMHLLGPTASCIVEGENGSLGPAMTFREQRHRQKNRGGSGGKSKSARSVSSMLISRA